MTFHRLVNSVSGSAGSALLHQFLVELDHTLLPVGTRFGRQSFPRIAISSLADSSHCLPARRNHLGPRPYFYPAVIFITS